MEKLEVGDVVLCTVDRIVHTTVFVKVKGFEEEGSIIISEIAPGRIRNLRDYVVPKKRIVCKVLRISEERIELSLRRVTQKERKEVLEQDKKEKSYKAILKKVFEEKQDKVIKEIEKKENLYWFLENAKTNPKELEKIVGKENTKKILEILNSQKKKTKILKKELHLTTLASDGLKKIKNLFENIKEIKVNYISAGKYSLKTEAEDIKTADKQLKAELEELAKKAKKEEIEFSVKEK